MVDLNELLQESGPDAVREYWDAAITKSSGNGSEAAKGGTHLIVQCAADVIAESVEWLWPGRIAIGKQTLIAGEAGLGKSQLSVALIAAVTTGKPWPCGEGCAPLGNVLILSAEDDAADTIVPRLMAASADLGRVHIVTAVRRKSDKGRRAFDLSADLDLLEKKVSEIGEVRMICIDPISSYLGQKIDSHVNAAVRSVLEPVSEMAARRRIAPVSITHPPKGTGTAAINRFIGSIAFVAAARTAFIVTRDPNDGSRRLFLPVKNNLAPLGKGLAFRIEQRIVSDGIVASSVVWESSPIDITADAALKAADARVSGSTSAVAEAEEFLKEILAAGSVPQKEVKAAAEDTGLAWVTVRRAKNQLGIKAIKDGMDGGWLWVLPKVLIEAEDAHLKGMSPFGSYEHLRSNGVAVHEHDDGLELLNLSTAEQA